MFSLWNDAASAIAKPRDAEKRYYHTDRDTMAGLGGAALATFTATDDEQKLVACVQRGDRTAFDDLTRRYSRRAFAIAYRILRHTQDAEDLVQDAFIAALDGIATFDSTRPFAPWFFKIVVNRSLNAANARSTRERYATVIHLWNNDSGAGDVDPAERSEIRARFQSAIDALPHHQRLIVELSDIDGRSSTEIGELLELPRGTVRWHLHQARKTLRVSLGILLEQPAPRLNRQLGNGSCAPVYARSA